eukprot:3380131-Pleurochrysis_carterae.AAC.2
MMQVRGPTRATHEISGVRVHSGTCPCTQTRVSSAASMQHASLAKVTGHIDRRVHARGDDESRMYSQAPQPSAHPIKTYEKKATTFSATQHNSSPGWKATMQYPVRNMPGNVRCDA